MADDAALLAGAPLFRALPAELLADLAGVAHSVRVGAGELLFRQGEPGDSLYIVRSGRLEVLVDGDVVRVHGRGEAFGELALLSGGVRTASVRARRDSDLLAVHGAEFDRLLAPQPAFAHALIQELGFRLRRGDVPTKPPSSSTVLALVPLQPELPVTAVRTIADALVGELAIHEAVARLDEVGGGEPWGARLDTAESAHPMVVLVAQRRSGAWWEFCVRQADDVLAIVDPALAAADEADEVRGCQVVALRTAGLSHWLDRLSPTAHHLVDLARPGDDVGRLARRVAGRSLGLVLSGGGARALAHIGVLEVLGEAGAQIDRVGGTSMGSFMAGLVAMGLDAGEMLSLARRELVGRRPFSDYTVSRHGLIRAKRAEAMLARVFGEATIEEQRTALFTVSVDLVSAREVVHRRGPIAEAVGLSSRLPGVAPPVWSGGKLHIDGGVLANLPIDVMVADSEGPVIAVDVMRPFHLAPGLRSGEALPNAVDTIARAMVLGSLRQAEAARALASAVITPVVDGIGLFDFRRVDDIVAAGRRAAEEALPGLRGLLGG